MRKILIVFMLLFLSGTGWGLADEASCEKSLDVNTLPPYTPLIKANMEDLRDYVTCEAVVKGDVNRCSAFSNPSSMTNCQDVYGKYAILAGLYENGQVPDKFLGQCAKISISKNACKQFGEALLSGNSAECKEIEGITPKSVAQCNELTSLDPESAGGRFMMALRKRDPALCDQIGPSSVVAICKGLLIKNGDGCQFNAGVDRFKKLYCQHLST